MTDSTNYGNGGRFCPLALVATDPASSLDSVAAHRGCIYLLWQHARHSGMRERRKRLCSVDPRAGAPRFVAVRLQEAISRENAES
jgi:hypothetical protein